MPFITIEGIDGSGKTTVWKAIRDEFPDFVMTQEPSTLWTGERVRRSIVGDGDDPLLTTFLFLADRANHANIGIEPWMDDHVVVSDRYHDSTVAYQTAALDGVVSGPLSFLEAARSFFPAPDLTILLDIPSDIALERSGRDDEVFEDRKFLTSVRENYLNIANREEGRVTVVDAWRPEDDVVEDVLGIIKEKPWK